MRKAMVVAGLVALAAVWPLGSAWAGGGCHSTTITESTGTAVNLEGFCFQPSVLRVAPGQSVTWTNHDQAEHMVYGQGWGSDLRIGKSYTVTFERAGTYAYACPLHPSMTGAVVVGDGSSGAAVPPVEPPASQPPAGGTSVGGTAATAAANGAASAAGSASVGDSTDAATPWKMATMVGFGLFAGALVVIGVGLGRRRESARTAPTRVMAG
jgi:plastocyanin